MRLINLQAGKSYLTRDGQMCRLAASKFTELLRTDDGCWYFTPQEAVEDDGFMHIIQGYPHPKDIRELVV